MYDATDSAGNSAESVTRTVNVFSCTLGSNEWVWINGDNVVDQAEDYGTKGVSAATNLPGSRRGSVSWVDSQNTLWMFGGSGYDASGLLVGTFNDLWKFDGTNWVWVSGSDTAQLAGDYGDKGVAAATNQPGARWIATTWVDSNDNLWLFGGEGYDSAGSFGYLNDLWKFDGVNWVWVSGSDLVSQNGNHGVVNVAAAANVPGSRYASLSWVDSDDQLWLFGGHGYDADGTLNRLNDLWMFDGENWTWISGSKFAAQSGVYGTKNVAAASNQPGARYSSIGWIDDEGIIWLFGGNGFDSTGFMSTLNDLWKFDGVNWTWVAGSDVFGEVGTYGTKGLAHVDNYPGARSQGLSWLDANGNFWLFGGSGKDGSNTWGRLNDLWKFNGSTWVWIAGDNVVDQSGVYGTSCTGTATNKPGARRLSASWVDSSNNLWLFGGVGFDSTGTRNLLNDLWRFSP